MASVERVLRPERRDSAVAVEGMLGGVRFSMTPAEAVARRPERVRAAEIFIVARERLEDVMWSWWRGKLVRGMVMGFIPRREPLCGGGPISELNC